MVIIARLPMDEGSAAATLGVWLQQQLPESIGFAIQAVPMLVSAVLILVGIVATFTAYEH
jgi:hypothetical protein